METVNYYTPWKRKQPYWGAKRNLNKEKVFSLALYTLILLVRILWHVSKVVYTCVNSFNSTKRKSNGAHQEKKPFFFFSLQFFLPFPFLFLPKREWRSQRRSLRVKEIDGRVKWLERAGGREGSRWCAPPPLWLLNAPTLLLRR